VKIADLAKDLRTGKKFSLHDELMERERQKRQQYNERRRLKKQGVSLPSDENNNGEQAGNGQAAPNGENTPAAATLGGGEPNSDGEAADPLPAPITRGGEQYRIVDGNIVLDEGSLQVDRHARALAEAGDMVEVEVNDFTRHTTTATYLRRTMKPGQWSDEDTEKFFHALSMFGTDFDTISRMFKDKTRKHVKLKFNREERANPQRIQAALVGQKTVSIDMEEYQRQVGREYEPAEAIYAEQKKAEEDFLAKQKAEEEAKLEEIRKRREELFGNPENGENGDGGKKKKGRGRKKVQQCAAW